MTEYSHGIDNGATFTDNALVRADGTLFGKKLLSTPSDYSLAIEQGVTALMHEAEIDGSRIGQIAHGTTVATNAIIERRGAAAALITTRGFRDVLELGRFRSPRLYDLKFRKPEPLVERRLRFEVTERCDTHGNILQPLALDELAAIAAAIEREDVQAIAICFLNSHVNPANEQTAVRYLAQRLPRVAVSASTDLVPQIGEYERTSTTVVNAYLRPVVEHYVTQLERRLTRLGIGAPLMIMQSSGGVLPAPLVARTPIFIIESGPAAGAQRRRARNQPGREPACAAHRRAAGRRAVQRARDAVRRCRAPVHRCVLPPSRWRMRRGSQRGRAAARRRSAAAAGARRLWQRRTTRNRRICRREVGHAREAYGVCIDSARMTVDVEATAACRSARAASSTRGD
jgi:hypothetical protein